MLALILTTRLMLELPLLGSPPAPEVLEEIGKLPGVENVEAQEGSLHIAVAPDAVVRLNEISEAIRRRTVRTEIDLDRIPLTRRTIFQMDAGQCFHCAQAPLGQRLSRRDWVERWAVVDYAAKGRMLFRVEPRGEARLELLGMLPFEDVLFTTRYDSVDEVFFDWPTGGVAWRATEEEARAEAARLRKPLLFFPTAGT